MELSDFIRPVYFPSLSKIVDKRIRESIGLSDWSTRIYSENENEIQMNKAVEMVLIKGCESINYEIIETERDIIIRYKWNDYELPKFDENYI